MQDRTTVMGSLVYGFKTELALPFGTKRNKTRTKTISTYSVSKKILSITMEQIYLKTMKRKDLSGD